MRETFRILTVKVSCKSEVSKEMVEKRIVDSSSVVLKSLSNDVISSLIRQLKMGTNGVP